MSKEICKIYTKIIVVCIPIGILVGIFCAIFTYGLNFVNSVRNKYVLYTIPFLCIAGLIITYINDKFDDKEISVKSGMKLVFLCGQNKQSKIPLILIPLVCISTWISNLCGGSCGREGVAVQIGAVISKRFSPFVNFEKSKQIFIVAGIASGFSAMFQTPIAGILFALEVLTVGKIKFFAIVPAIVESIVAYYTAHIFRLSTECYSVRDFDIIRFGEAQGIDFVILLKIAVASIAFSIIGCLFSVTLERCKDLYSKYVKNKYLGIFVSGIILSILLLLLHFGRYSGTGSNLISICFNDNAGGIYAYDFAMKAMFTILTLSVGFYGGEVTPIFTVGATFGFILAKVLGIDTGLLASLGFISVFASATNTLFCPIALGIEIFGMHNLPYYIISVAIAYFCNFNKSIYPQEKMTEVKNQRLIDYFQF